MQLILPFMTMDNKEAPEDFEEYMKWLGELKEKNPEAYEKEFGRDLFNQKNNKNIHAT